MDKKTDHTDGSIELKSEDVDKLSKFLKYKIGLKFECYRRGFFEKRITYRMDKLGYESLQKYINFLISDKKEIYYFLDQFTINYTYFFRNYDIYKGLIKTIEKFGKSKIKIWSAPCSTGEEPYSLAIILDQLKQKNTSLLDFEIIASDIDARAISIAKKGEYSGDLLNETPDLYKKLYFEQFPKNNRLHYRVKKSLKEKITFLEEDIIDGHKNLIKYDIVFCRNFLIYLNDYGRERLFQTIQDKLVDGGVLVLGQTESLHNSDIFKPLDLNNRFFLKDEFFQLHQFEKERMRKKRSSIAQLTLARRKGSQKQLKEEVDIAKKVVMEQEIKDAVNVIGKDKSREIKSNKEEEKEAERASRNERPLTKEKVYKKTLYKREERIKEEAEKGKQDPLILPLEEVKPKTPVIEDFQSFKNRLRRKRLEFKKKLEREEEIFMDQIHEEKFEFNDKINKMEEDFQKQIVEMRMQFKKEQEEDLHAFKNIIRRLKDEFKRGMMAEEALYKKKVKELNDKEGGSIDPADNLNIGYLEQHERNDRVSNPNSKGELVIPAGNYALIDLYEHSTTKLAIYGLGASVALILQDPSNKVYAMSHILHSSSTISEEKHTITHPHKFADTSVRDLLKKVLSQGAEKDHLSAYIIGGNEGLDQGDNVDSNVASVVEEKLNSYNIPIEGKDIGGKKGRIIVLEALYDTVLVKKFGQSKFSQV